MKNGIELIAAERTRQIEVEGYTPALDLEYYNDGVLSTAAACYATHEPDRRNLISVIGIKGNVSIWGKDNLVCGVDAFPFTLDNRDKHDRLRRLVIAGALIAAEIDRYLAENPGEATK